MIDDESWTLNTNRLVTVEQAVLLMLGYSETYVFETVEIEGAEELAFDISIALDEIDDAVKARTVLQSAKQYKDQIQDEIATIRNGKKSELILEDPKETHLPLITKSSFYKWLNDQRDDQNSENDKTEAQAIVSDTIFLNTQKALYMTSVALAKLLDDARAKGVIEKEKDKKSGGVLNTKALKNDGTPNAAALVRFIMEKNEHIQGANDRTLKTRMKEAKEVSLKIDSTNISKIDLEKAITDSEDSA